MTQVTQGSLTMIGLNTVFPTVFWNGKAVTGVVSIRVDHDFDEQRVKLKVNGTDDALYSEMFAAGITVKKVVV